MSQIDPLKEKTPLDEIKETFHFLIEDYHFKLTKTEINENFKAKYFAVYLNVDSKIQIEICGDSNWFHCEIRRLINGVPAKYSDRENCIGLEDLAVLVSNNSNNNCEHFHYFVGKIGLKSVLRNTAKLFKRNASFFTTDHWIDVKRIEKLKNSKFEKKFGILPDHNMPTFIRELKNRASHILYDKGYMLITENDEYSPFSNKIVNDITFHNGNKTIKIAQLDWRDSYFIYYISVDHKKVFELDIRHRELSESVDCMLQKLLKI